MREDGGKCKLDLWGDGSMGAEEDLWIPRFYFTPMVTRALVLTDQQNAGVKENEKGVQLEQHCPVEFSMIAISLR
ncbi:MAG: hypothetical protein P4N60_08565 [Verrucomicrobiae bacterium]|nr:hypothetical protein [Verrucomicrobiae bacterium]